MKVSPLRISRWVVVLVCSSALVELMKLPNKILVEKYPCVAVWLLSIFGAVLMALFLFLGFRYARIFQAYKQQRHKKMQQEQEIEKCQQLLDEMKRDNDRKEELEILHKKEELGRRGVR